MGTIEDIDTRRVDGLESGRIGLRGQAMVDEVPPVFIARLAPEPPCRVADIEDGFVDRLECLDLACYPLRRGRAGLAPQLMVRRGQDIDGIADNPELPRLASDETAVAGIAGLAPE